MKKVSGLKYECQSSSSAAAAERESGKKLMEKLEATNLREHFQELFPRFLATTMRIKLKKKKEEEEEGVSKGFSE